MSFDISHLLDQWDYQPGQVVVRKFTGKDGIEKIQLRVDLGILQMNAQGRPDGKRPFGHPSLFEYYVAKCNRVQKSAKDDDFSLKAEDCAKLQMEALQYHHRYICLLQLEDFAGVVRDADRNMQLFEFVSEHAETEELAWALLQFRPQVIMIRTRALASMKLQVKDFPAALGLIESGIEELREFYHTHSRHDLMEQSPEIFSLQHWLEELKRQRPLSPREQLEIALDEAVKREDYEKAAEVRDKLRNLKQTE